jgi:hypothetical protein
MNFVNKFKCFFGFHDLPFEDWRYIGNTMYKVCRRCHDWVVIFKSTEE